MLGDIDLTGQDDDQALAHFTDLGQRLTRPVGANLAESTHTLDLLLIEVREHLGASRVDDRLRRQRHHLSLLVKRAPG
jgi:hypothetical protein